MDVAGYVVEAIIFVIMFTLADKLLDWIKERKTRERLEVLLEHEDFFQEVIKDSLYAIETNPKKYRLSEKERYGE